MSVFRVLPVELKALVASFLTIRETEDWCLTYWGTLARVLSHPQHRARVTMHLQSMKKVLDYQMKRAREQGDGTLRYRQWKETRYHVWVERLQQHMEHEHSITLIYACAHYPDSYHQSAHVGPPMVCLI